MFLALPSHSPLLALTLAAAIALPGRIAGAADATTPVGYMQVEAAAGTGTTHAITPLAIPLLPPVSGISGAMTGRISAVKTKAIDCSPAGWSAQALAAKETPLFLYIKSGTAAGHAFRITDNDSASITLDTRGATLASLGVTEGDTWEITKGWTLRGLFGTSASGVIGGTSADFSFARTDKVLVNDTGGATLVFYFDTSSGHWKRAGSTSSQDNLPISPTAGVFYYRIASSALPFSGVGQAIDFSLKRLLIASGSAVLSPGYPVEMRVSSLGVHLLSTWRRLGDAGVTLASADRLVIKDPSSTGTLSLYYDKDTFSWKREGSQIDWGSQTLPAGTAVMLTRNGRGEIHEWSQVMPISIPAP